MTPCSLCGSPTPEGDLCHDLACRGCHVSLTFEACCDGSRVAEQRPAAGLLAEEEPL